jgi:hypothetical protein
METFKSYELIEIDLLDIGTNTYVTHKGYFVRHIKENKVEIVIGGTYFITDINKIRKLKGDKNEHKD